MSDCVRQYPISISIPSTGRSGLIQRAAARSATRPSSSSGRGVRRWLFGHLKLYNPIVFQSRSLSSFYDIHFPFWRFKSYYDDDIWTPVSLSERRCIRCDMSPNRARGKPQDDTQSGNKERDHFLFQTLREDRLHTQSLVKR